VDRELSYCASLLLLRAQGTHNAAQQALAADDAIANFSSNLFLAP